LIFKGAITAEIFENWLDVDLLPTIDRPAGMQLIIIMDNCRIHKSPRVKEICRRHNVLLEFLPPYCPFFNPIEASFHDLKAYIRRHYRMRNGTYDNFEEFLGEALRKMGRGEDAASRARAHFRYAGYLGVPDEIN
jgi:transposase